MCPAGPMHVIAFIERPDVIRKILEHPGLWKTRRSVWPRSHALTATGHDGCGDSWMPSTDDYLTDRVWGLGKK